MATIEDITTELYELGEKLGIHHADITKAVEQRDKHQLLVMREKWRRGFKARSQEIHSAINKREANQRALRAEDTHSRFKETDRARIKWERENTPLAERLQHVVSQMRLRESRATTSSFAATRGGETEQVGPPGTFDPAGDLIDKTPLKLIKVHIEDLEAQVDALTGVGPPSDRMTPAARGEILDSLAGVKSEDLAGYFGYSQRTIENWRVERAEEQGIKVSPSTGLPR